MKYMKFIKRSLNHLKWMLDKVGFFNCLSDEAYLKFCYRFRIGKKLNLDTPKTFNEKIQWLKINDRNPKYIKMVRNILFQLMGYMIHSKR